MHIPVASDHAGFEAKTKVIAILKELGHQIEDLGPNSADRVDYPDYAIKVAEKVDQGTTPIGILICGSGQGMCMTANKFANVRAALVYDQHVAALSRQHNNANVLCLPGRNLNEDQLKEILTSYFNAEFEGGRHIQRVEKIKSLTIG